MGERKDKLAQNKLLFKTIDAYCLLCLVEKHLNLLLAIAFLNARENSVLNRCFSKSEFIYS